MLGRCLRSWLQYACITCEHANRHGWSQNNPVDGISWCRHARFSHLSAAIPKRTSLAMLFPLATNRLLRPLDGLDPPDVALKTLDLPTKLSELILLRTWVDSGLSW